jgi:hypothetical protein
MSACASMGRRRKLERRGDRAYIIEHHVHIHVRQRRRDFDVFGGVFRWRDLAKEVIDSVGGRSNNRHKGTHTHTHTHTHTGRQTARQVESSRQPDRSTGRQTKE